MDISIREKTPDELDYKNEMNGLYGLANDSVRKGISYTLHIDIPKAHIRDHNKVIEILRTNGTDAQTLKHVHLKLQDLNPSDDDETYYSRIIESIAESMSARNSLEKENKDYHSLNKLLFLGHNNEDKLSVVYESLRSHACTSRIQTYASDDPPELVTPRQTPQLKQEIPTKNKSCVAYIKACFGGAS